MSGWSLKEQRCRWLDGCVVSHWKTEGQMKKWEGWLVLSLSQLSLEVVDWNGMDMWWGLGEEMYGVLSWRQKTGWKPKKDMVRECRSGYGRTWDWQRRCSWQKEMKKECYEEEVQPYRKTDYKPIIYIYTYITIPHFHETTRKQNYNENMNDNWENCMERHVNELFEIHLLFSHLMILLNNYKIKIFDWQLVLI